MVFVEDLSDVVEVIVILGLLIPRGGQKGVDIAHDEGSFKGAFRHHLESL